MGPVSGVLPKLVRIVATVVVPFIHDSVTRTIENIFCSPLIILPSQIIHITNTPIGQRMGRRQRRSRFRIQSPLPVVGNASARAVADVKERIVMVVGVQGCREAYLL